MSLFTICIPTYNRADKLAVALGAILPQVAAHKDVASVYVSDNCSDDNTQSVVEEFKLRFPGVLQSKRQTCNLGSERNYKDAIASVGSKYVAIMGDDDVAMPDYLETILTSIEEYPNVALVNVNMLILLNGRCVGPRDPMLLAGEGRYYDEGGSFVVEHHHYPSHMSSNVFIRENFMRVAETINPDDYPGYGWYMTLLQGVIDKPVLYLDRPLVWIDGSSGTRWRQEALAYGCLGLGRIFLELDAQYPGIMTTWNTELTWGWIGRSMLVDAANFRSYYSCQYSKLTTYIRDDLFCSNLRFALSHSARHTLWHDRLLRIKMLWGSNTAQHREINWKLYIIDQLRNMVMRRWWSKGRGSINSNSKSVY